MSNNDPVRLISDIEYEFGLKPGSLASKTVSKFTSKARRKAILQLRKLGLSFPEIGKYLRRDHTSVMRLVKAGEKAVDIAGKRPKK
jgi:chromosomal replication initiation ATPase DnaA